jgi:predicted DCC family thiol-disulfide oxidoreductase YuxK
MTLSEKQLVLFDGVCNVCNALILFIIDRDPNERFVFASLSSELGQRVVKEHALGEIDSVVLVEDGRPYTHSTAVLRILARLRGLWFFMWLLFVIPRFLRDAAYRFFARNRYTWFGKQDVCRVPTPELRRRFVS